MNRIYILQTMCMYEIGTCFQTPILITMGHKTFYNIPLAMNPNMCIMLILKLTVRTVAFANMQYEG